MVLLGIDSLGICLVTVHGQDKGLPTVAGSPAAISADIKINEPGRAKASQLPRKKAKCGLTSFPQSLLVSHSGDWRFRSQEQMIAMDLETHLAQARLILQYLQPSACRSRKPAIQSKLVPPLYRSVPKSANRCPPVTHGWDRSSSPSWFLYSIHRDNGSRYQGQPPR